MSTDPKLDQTENPANDGDLCGCDRLDELDNPHRHGRDAVCDLWAAARVAGPEKILAVAARALGLPYGAVVLAGDDADDADENADAVLVRRSDLPTGTPASDDDVFRVDIGGRDRHWTAVPAPPGYFREQALRLLAAQEHFAAVDDARERTAKKEQVDRLATDLVKVMQAAPDHGGWRAGMDDDDYRALAEHVITAGWSR